MSTGPECEKDFSTEWLKSKLIMFSSFMGLSTDRSKKKNGHIEENEG